MTGHFTVGRLRDLTARAIISSRELVSRRAPSRSFPRRVAPRPFKSAHYERAPLSIAPSDSSCRGAASGDTYEYACLVCVKINHYRERLVSDFTFGLWKRRESAGEER